MVQRAPPHHQLGRRVTERLLFVRRGTRSAQAQEQRQCSIGSYILTPLRRHILTSLRMRNIFRLSTSKPKRRRKAFLSSRAKKALSWRKNAEPLGRHAALLVGRCSAVGDYAHAGFWEVNCTFSIVAGDMSASLPRQFAAVSSSHVGIFAAPDANSAPLPASGKCHRGCCVGRGVPASGWLR